MRNVVIYDNGDDLVARDTAEAAALALPELMHSLDGKSPKHVIQNA